VKRSHRQRGFTVVSFALFLSGLMAMAALAVDVGVLYTARTSAQHAADAAALAAAFTFVDGNTNQPTAAINSAIAIAGQNKVMGQPVSITAANVSVDLANQRVTVTVPRTGGNGIGTYFARIMDINSADVQAKATAEAWLSGAASQCLKPIFLPNTILSSAANVTTACNRGEVLFDRTTYHLTAWGDSRVPTTSAVDIRPMKPSGALEPSQYYSLDFGSGGNTYRCTLGQCLNECGVTAVHCGSPLPVETGALNGPTKQGVEDLIGNPPDTWIAPGQYGTSTGPATTSRSLVVAPVWDSCDPNNDIRSGKHGQTIKVVGFVTAFVTGMSGNNVQAYIVSRAECAGSGVSGVNANATGPYGIPVRLVQNP
jgi:Flp pilus assembly protein TadG